MTGTGAGPAADTATGGRSNGVQLMMIITLNEATAALRRIPVYLVDETDGVTPETGITFSAGDIKVSENGAAQANHAGTVTEVGLGLYYYECATTEVDTEGFLSIIFTTRPASAPSTRWPRCGRRRPSRRRSGRRRSAA